jgi:hypothetical protein
VLPTHPQRLLAAALALSAPTATAAPYRGAGLQDLPFHLARERYVPIELWMGLDVTVSVADDLDPAAYAHADQLVDVLIGRSWRIVSDLLQAGGHWRVPCRSDAYNLNVFMVRGALLEDRHRFRHMYEDPRVGVLPGHAIYGYYDPTPEVPNHSLIVLGLGLGDTFPALSVHELGHYWWDRMCLTERLPAWTSETFASRVQADFTRLYGP